MDYLNMIDQMGLNLQIYVKVNVYCFLVLEIFYYCNKTVMFKAVKRMK